MSSDNHSKETQPGKDRSTLIPNRLFPRIALYTASAAVVLLFTVWLAIPPLAKWYLSHFYEEQNRTFSAHDISVDFFPPSIHLENVLVSHENSKELEIKTLDLQVSIAPLFNKTVYISKANIDGLYVLASQDDNIWNVAGINIPINSGEPSNDEETAAPLTAQAEETLGKPSENDSLASGSQSNKPSSPWTVIVPKLSINNSQFTVHNLLNDAVTDTYTIDHLELDKLNNRGTDVSLSIVLDSRFNQSHFSLKSDIAYFDSLADVQLESLSVDASITDFLHFLPQEYRSLSGTIESSMTGTIKQRSATEFDIALPKLNNHLSQLSVDIPNIVTNLEELTIDLSNIELDNQINGDINIKGTLDTSLANLNAAIDSNRINTNILSVNLEQFVVSRENGEIRFSAPNVNLNNGTTHFESTDLTLANGTAQVQLQNLQATFNNINTLKLSTALSTEISNSNVNLGNLQLVNGGLKSKFEELELLHSNNQLDATVSNVTINNSKFSLKKSEDTLASFAELNVDMPKFNYAGESYKGELSSIKMTDINLSDPTDAPPLTALESLIVQGIQTDENGAQINKIALTGLKTHALLDENRQLINLIPLSDKNSTKGSDGKTESNNTGSTVSATKQETNKEESTKEEVLTLKTDETATNTTQSESFTLLLNEFNLSGDSYIQLLDKGVDPDLDTKIEIERLSATHIDSSDKDSITNVVLIAKNGKYSSINLNADIQPFTEKLTMQTKLTIRETELPPYSPYIAQALGYRIDSGQMDMDLDLNADHGQLEGNTHLVFREFDLGGRQESSKVMQTGAMPLNIAVGVLKDGQGNIELDIPLEGDIDNPEFKWTGFLMLPIKQALYKASTSYLMQTFVPYANVISIAQIAGEQILKIRVEPLAFELQQGQIVPAQFDYLNQLSALMTDKSDSQVKACGFAVIGDLSENNELILTEPEQQDAYLNSLANERANSLKDYLVNKGIASNRIFVCAPKIDRDEDATPRVELKF
ncbi:DUF748 domain-containing protein [Marinomonas balearica]|uniref:Uncharacterized protein DUF748 n=1 Tax=Marinomonas balearica TaxID=491947 RepID=A0A4R6MBZ0_9GAMM|nr:DUF748 domain-containing protein [Marinomonas balearica]TDO98994.1 uncharacterized protein DUF748 [Marinomonas balearica]